MNNNFLFRNRREAGKILSGRLLAYRTERPIIAALPRGGVVIGFEVAKALDSRLDIILARKIGAPGNPEFGVGAVAEKGVCLFNGASLDALGLRPDDLRDSIEIERAELKRRRALYGRASHRQSFADRVVIIVDDGVATGITARAAIAAVRRQKPGKIIFAAPVCSRDAARSLQRLADEFICLYQPEYFSSVGNWYQEFEQLTDEEVTAILKDCDQGFKKMI